MLITELIECIEKNVDPAMAADWDQSGIQVAGSKDRIHRLALTLDPRPESIRKALDWNADFVLSHHPLTLSPRLPKDRDELHKVYALLFQSGVGLYAAHTSLDVHIQGPAGWLARALRCTHIRPVHPIQPPARIWIALERSLVPPAAWDEIVNHPICLQWTISDTDCHLLVAESQVDTLLRQVSATTNLDRVRMSKTLPVRTQHGYGIMGQLPEPMTWSALSSVLSSHLSSSAWTLTGSPPDRIHTVAYCPGSGMELAVKAFAQGADIYISGDLKYHQAQEIEAWGLTLDVGHFSLEEKMMSTWAHALGEDLAQQEVEVTFIPGHNPLRTQACPH
ncbi:MAG: Nif3-like dinuclear metal center hexameric protein [Desulfovermiculus sp.]|nr:Nif3-like dinuclear metal center hexameric protein [Desulfovermiculus sp.]